MALSTVPTGSTPLTFNPSYRTSDVTYGSCPPGSATSRSATGDSVLGLYGPEYQQFLQPSPACLTCDPCQQNTVSPLFYRSRYSVRHPTYALMYRGQDHYFRKPY